MLESLESNLRPLESEAATSFNTQSQLPVSNTPQTAITDEVIDVVGNKSLEPSIIPLEPILARVKGNGAFSNAGIESVLHWLSS